MNYKKDSLLESVESVITSSDNSLMEGKVTQRTRAEVADFVKFKASQYFRLKNIKIPKDAEDQKKLLDTIPQDIKQKWALELIAMSTES